MVLEQDGRMERSFDIYSRLLRERIVFLGQEVNDDIANLIAAQLLHLDAQEPGKDIYLYVNSPGGSAYAGMAIYDAMQYVKSDVSTVCLGMGMSVGARSASRRGCCSCSTAITVAARPGRSAWACRTCARGKTRFRSTCCRSATTGGGRRSRSSIPGRGRSSSRTPSGRSATSARR